MSDTSEPITPKINLEDLEIRAKPRPVTRINRKVLYLLSGTGLMLIFGATIFALNPPSIFDKNTGGNELYNIDNKPSPDGLEGLPRKYSDLSKPPELGSPLPGDLGSAIIKVERDLGIQPAPALPFRPNPVEDAERAERIRQARLAQQGRESGVFFQLALRNSGALPDTSTKLATAPTNASSGNPFNAISAAGSSTNTSLQLNRNNDQNLQGRKLDFLNQKVDGKIYNPHKLQTPESPYQIMAGTIISASLITGINSDLPGNVIAQVTENIYDTATGGHLLIPQGARMMGTYDSVVAFGQERALLVWQRIILPDGSSIVIDNLPGTDTAGYAGLEDKVNFHTWKLLKGIVLSTLLGVSTELTFGDQESDLVKAIRESAQDSTNQVGQSLTERNLNIQPTITIRQGWPLRIIVNKDMILRPYIIKGAIR
ncbi:MAG: TrbI/VirB10 family protein [Rhizobiaceae bacterium]|nr:TrbI/VirB10 family protein [Rhizobiaceae bacterium]MBL4696429.1 TrbI/VirB10 family protein [Rhizobiaceae bacterium]